MWTRVVAVSFAATASGIWISGCATVSTSSNANESIAAAALGETKESAIEVCMPQGERAYLASLVCPNGKSPEFSREGSVGPRFDIPRDISEAEENKLMRQALGEPLQPGDVDHHFIDLYAVRCGRVSTRLYFDMYHCGQNQSSATPRGFTRRIE